MTSSPTRTCRPRRWLPCSLASAAALVLLTACGGGSPAGDSSPTSASSSSPTATGSPPGSTGAPSQEPSGATGQDAGKPSDRDLLRAGATAQARVRGSTLISIETEAGGSRWEVQVATSDGAEHELDVSGDGRDVVSGPRTEHEDADDRAKHRRRLEAAEIDFRQAARKASGAVPGGRITELNLDTYRGTTVWEADVIDRSGLRHSVKLDAGSGEVVVNATGSD